MICLPFLLLFCFAGVFSSLHVFNYSPTSSRELCRLISFHWVHPILLLTRRRRRTKSFLCFCFDEGRCSFASKFMKHLPLMLMVPLTAQPGERKQKSIPVSKRSTKSETAKNVCKVFESVVS